MQHVFIVGSKSLGAYGGYETFVNKLTEYHQNNQYLIYHVACKANGDGGMDDTKLDGVKPLSKTEFIYHNAKCFKIHIPNIGPPGAIYYDVAALNYCFKYIKQNGIEHPIVYILACRIGPFAAHFQKEIHKLGGKIYVNPDGHEWLRAKWSAPVRKYWKISEKLMVKYADLLICDSKNIEKYIRKIYASYNPRTTYIAYGAETQKSILTENDVKLVDWYKEKRLSPRQYYLAVGRFVPENNYEVMIKEFMESKSTHDFALITNVSDKFLEELKQKTKFDKDPRIKFVGTVYDQELLKKIRENAYGYFHGHEVGGTNPSLLEALGSTDLNLLLNVGFNREVGEDAALYWGKGNGELAKLIEKADAMSEKRIKALGIKAKKRIADAYSWEYIVSEYKKVFLNDLK
jgi:rhamnosyltransferase